MTRTEKIEQIVTKMEHLEEHNCLEQEIRADMAEIGIDFDTVRAEFEDMSELGRLLRATL